MIFCGEVKNLRNSTHGSGYHYDGKTNPVTWQTWLPLLVVQSNTELFVGASASSIGIDEFGNIWSSSAVIMIVGTLI